MHYTFPQTLLLLRISRSTLLRWCLSASITPTQDPMDHRRLYFSRAQVSHLAKLHRRVILQQDGDAPTLEHRITLLEQQVAHLLSCLQDKQK